ncbi:hypothetical protein PoMZ_13590 [Pyricularia oryzae]|uniref:Uncharacterized protein n=1 Tax=Pyricularia oryzae TaxID=318829 RepID=A0A4P7NVJ4_PYROR|nr:hypothetical protein PoMZ_13590 [Pyricularia oryzae]
MHGTARLPRHSVQTAPPVVVRTGNRTPGIDAVEDTCVVLDHGGQETAVPRTFSTSPMAPACNAVGWTRSLTRLIGGRGSSSSRGASSEEKSIYFAIHTLAIGWHGTSP